MRRLLVVILLALAGLAPARADIVIEASPGGEATSFLRFFEAVRLSGERVAVDGPCFSACTLALSACLAAGFARRRAPSSAFTRQD